MRSRLALGLLFCGLAWSQGLRNYDTDPNLMREVAAVRAEVVRSSAALRQYTWTEHTEILVKGSVKSSTASTCRYDGSGQIIRTLVAGEKTDKANPVSNRPMVRSKADMQDYIERAISRIRTYIPPKPEQIDYLLLNGYASMGQTAGGQSEVRFTYYYQDGDSLVFTYDTASKMLLRVSVASNLAGPKDPVTMEAVFEALPDGVNHLSSATLNANAKKVQVKMRNVLHQKVTN